MGKNIPTTDKIIIPTNSILSALKLGLNNLNAITTGSKNIRAKDITLINGGNTVLCEYYSEYNKNIDVKGEFVIIMSFLSSFFKDNTCDNIQADYFAVKALDENGREIMYAVCRQKSAETLSSGNAVEWLKNTYFQENTADYRLARAKTFISDIENSLRHAIGGIYKQKFQNNWWHMAIDKKIADSIERTYLNNFGTATSDGEVLLNYSFTLDLKKIVSADWGSFSYLFQNKAAFEDSMVELNLIRREEAHNREISEQHLIDLERIYDFLLGEIAVRYPKLTLNYLVENWRYRIKAIMIHPIKETYTQSEFQLLRSNDEKIQLIIKDSEAQIVYIDGILDKLRSLKPPISKRQKHEELIGVFVDYRELQNRKLDCAINKDFDQVGEIVNALKQQLAKMDEFSFEFLMSEG